MEMVEEDNTEYFYEPNSDEENGDDADEFNNLNNDTNSSPPRLSLEPDEVGWLPTSNNESISFRMEIQHFIAHVLKGMKISHKRSSTNFRKDHQSILTKRIK
jgi:hypothetical protein